MTPIFPLIAVLGLLIPVSVHAFEIQASSVQLLCAILPCSSGGGGSAGLSMYLLDKVVLALEVGIIAAAILSLFATAVTMVMSGSSGEETGVTESRKSYIYIITGLAVVGLARWFVNAFSPGVPVGNMGGNGGTLVNTAVVEGGVANIIVYFRLIIAVTLMVNIVVQAFRLITSQGQQEQVDKAKKRLIGGFIGAGIIMMANVIVISVVPGFGGSSMLAIEIAGIANYMLAILGFLTVVALIVAGVLLIVSVDESLKEKAKTIVKTCVAALIVVITSYALITAFIL